jgi:hypothetical protein
MVCALRAWFFDNSHRLLLLLQNNAQVDAIRKNVQSPIGQQVINHSKNEGKEGHLEFDQHASLGSLQKFGVVIVILVINPRLLRKVFQSIQIVDEERATRPPWRPIFRST